MGHHPSDCEDRVINTQTHNLSPKVFLPFSLLAFLSIFAIGNYGFALNQQQIHWWADAAWTLASLATAAQCWLTARSSKGEIRLAWQAYAVACLSWGIGMLVWDYQELIAGKITPFPALSDFGFMGFALLFIAGTYFFYRRTAGAAFTMMQLSKLGIIVCAVGITHMVIFYDRLTADEQDAFYLTVAMAYPLLYMTMFIYNAFNYLTYRQGLDAGIAGLVLLAGLVHAFTCTLYAYELLGHSYQAGHYLDIFWLLGFALLFWAAGLQRRSEPGRSKGKTALQRVLLLENLLPPLVLLIASLIISIAAYGKGGPLISVMPVLFALILLIALRDWLGQRQINSLLTALRDNEARYRSLFEGASETICIYDVANSRIVDINQAGEELFGRNREELLSIDYSRLLPPPQTTQSNSTEPASSHIEKAVAGTPACFESHILRSDGQQLPCEIRLTRLPVNDKTLLYALITDISDRIQARTLLESQRDELEKRVKERTRELELSREEAIQANAAKSQFLSRMSHELRTPLNAILGFSQLLQKDDAIVNTENQDSVDEIVRAGFHLLDLINDMLDLSRIETDNLKILSQAMPFNKAVEESLALIRPRAAADDISVQYAPDPQLNDLVLFTDPLRFKQIMINLLSNSVKYNRKGGSIHVTTNLIDASRLRISVRDTGIGIAEDLLDQLFEPFNRLGIENRMSTQGIGIGLSICHHLVGLMQGDLFAESTVGEGSTFHLILPLHHN